MNLKKILALTTLPIATILLVGDRKLEQDFRDYGLDIKYTQRDFFGFFRKVKIEEFSEDGSLIIVDSNNPAYLGRRILGKQIVEYGDGKFEGFRFTGEVCVDEAEIRERWEDYRDIALCFMYHQFFSTGSGSQRENDLS